MRVTRQMCREAVDQDGVTFNETPIQLGMGKDPWRVAVCSFLLCRAKRVQMKEPLRSLLWHWPTAAALVSANTDELEAVLRPCGLHRQRARQLQRFSSLYTADMWQELSDLPGVGAYVNSSVGLFCFGLTDLECEDKALVGYVRQLATQSA
jgi:endonuclease III